MSANPIYIYGLLDPRDNQLRYVGRTISEKTRLYNHKADARGKRPKAMWMRGLLKAGLEPKMIVFSEETADTWRQAERETIARYRSLGCPLFNIVNGGGAFKTFEATLSAKVMLSMEPDLKAFYEELARKDRRSLSGMIRFVLKRHREASEVQPA